MDSNFTGQNIKDKYFNAFLFSTEAFYINRLIDGKFVDVNEEFTKLIGYCLVDLDNNSFFDGLFFSDPLTAQTLAGLLVKKRRISNFETEIKKKNGTSFSASVSSVIFKIENIDFVVTEIKDISAIKNKNTASDKALHKSQDSDKFKLLLIENMNHEFRTPITGILGISSLLIENIDDPEQKKMLREISDSGNKIINTLDIVMELANLESHGEIQNQQAVNISSIALDICSDFNSKAMQKGLGFNYKISESDINVKSTNKLIKHIISHLLENAIRFTEKGNINFQLDSEITENIQYAKIIVTDTGIGISDDAQKSIFSKFTAASENITKNYDESGLGLSLIFKIVNIMKGKVLLTSQLGGGSAFTVLLPAAANSRQLPADIVEIKTEKKYSEEFTMELLPEILLVEDNSINANVASLYLKNICRVIHTKDGNSAIKKAQENFYPLILMDINLGHGIDGITASKEIRKIDGYANVPIVAVTGYSLDVDKGKFLAEGLTHFLPKPFSKAELVDIVEEIFQQNRIRKNNL